MCSYRRLVVAMSTAVFMLSGCSFEEQNENTVQIQEVPGTGQQTGANNAPRVEGVPPTTVVAGAVYSFQVIASDPDGDALTYTATGLPAWAWMNAQTGLLTGTPAEADAGVTADILISVSDGRQSTSLTPFRVSISPAAPPASPPVTTPPATPPATAPATPVNNPPSISGSPALSVQATVRYSFTPSASDPESSPLTFSVSNKPAWAAFSSSTGTLSGTPSNAHAGTYGNIVITASDGTLTASLPAFTIVVSAANRAPVISGTPAAAGASGSSYSFTPSASDPDGDTLAFSITGKPSWATFSTATGALTGTAQAGEYPNIVISVSDGTVTRSLAAFTLTVPANAGTATLSWTAPTQNTDGSALTDLAGYRVYHGTQPGTYSDVTEIQGVTNTSYAFTQLTRGTHYFAVASLTRGGMESELTAAGSKTIN